MPDPTPTNNAFGKVQKMGASKDGATFVLDMLDQIKPKDDQFLLPLAHENYNGLHSLVMAAAINNLPLKVRAESVITPGEVAKVSFVVMTV